MLATVLSSAVHGVDALVVEVEVDIASGLPQMAIVGLPDGAVKESMDRVRAALNNSGYEFPQRYNTINLAPADIKKEGPAYDLPIGLGLLAARARCRRRNCPSTRSRGTGARRTREKALWMALPIARRRRRRGGAGSLCPRKTPTRQR